MMLNGWRERAGGTAAESYIVSTYCPQHDKLLELHLSPLMISPKCLYIHYPPPKTNWLDYVSP